jgi:anti-sigma factor RsiW
MNSCDTINALVTPYVDGELADREREAVDRHLQRCPPCYQRVAAEQAIRGLIQARKPALRRECASAALRARCAGLKGRTAPPAAIASSGATTTAARVAGAWRTRLAPFALAASLVVLVGGAFVYQLTERSTTVMAAELTADHMKCFAVNSVLGTHQPLSVVESSMTGTFGWDARLPDNAEGGGLELVGSRPCLYGEGRVAHIMYRYHGHPVSLFMLPNAVRRQSLTSVMGHECAVWSSGGRTFVLITREPRDDVARMASFVQASLAREIK